MYSTCTLIITILFFWSFGSSTFPEIFAETQAPEVCHSAMILLTCADKWMEFKCNHQALLCADRMRVWCRNNSPDG